jgi:tetratricopeptide (TPR) repeat protein
VRATRGPRPPRDKDLERARIEERVIEQWEPVDEDLRDEAVSAASRAATPTRSAPRKRAASVDPEVAAAITAAAPDRRVAARMIERLAHAQEALDRDRLDEARRTIASVVRTVPGVAAVHEVAGLVAYRLGRWREAVRELEVAGGLEPNVALLPVLADSYRALQRWDDVERVWLELREASPAQDVLAEGRIVAAGAQADRGDLAGALRTMSRVPADPKRVRDHHLRQWYVVGDLNDRAGNTLEAARWFERVVRQDPDFVDAAQRLRSLGRR